MSSAQSTQKRETGLAAPEYDSADALVAQKAWIQVLRGDDGALESGLSALQWECLIEEARRHRLTGMTYHALSRHPAADAVPALVLQRMRPAYLDTALRNAVAFRHTARMTRRLAQRDIPVMLLKGLHLARYTYAEPAMRNMADIDIMVPRDRLAETEQIFVAEDYGPTPRPNLEEFCTWSNHLARLQRPGEPMFEVHWSIERPTSPFRIDLDGLWDRARTASLEGATVHLLAPEDLLLHLTLHASYHHRFDHSAFKALADIDAVVRRHRDELDWPALVDRAVEWGAAGFLFATLRLTADVLATPVPEHELQRLPREREDEEIVDIARRHILMPGQELPRVYVEVATSRGVRDRSVLLLRHVFVPRRVLRRIYALPDDAFVWPWYVHRVGSLLARRGRLALRSIFRTRALRGTLDREAERRRIQAWVKDMPGLGRPDADPHSDTVY